MEWISIYDALPEEHVPVLIAYKDYKEKETYKNAVASIDRDGYWSWRYGNYAGETIFAYIYHWMPLPDPPKDSCISIENTY